ncbi:hypothetical protein BD289DRAFT_95860 [Coniella lustricola]|uniref:Uncharacterized protein n=1 Tax=Coniella lustricola TaxID=2025994 RepID=A0A2T2ZY32_9PEZI|nr:hypothetical protein BD289DRAFT_95860 [Coniella lustricola]
MQSEYVLSIPSARRRDRITLGNRDWRVSSLLVQAWVRTSVLSQPRSWVSKYYFAEARMPLLFPYSCDVDVRVGLRNTGIDMQRTAWNSHTQNEASAWKPLLGLDALQIHIYHREPSLAMVSTAGRSHVLKCLLLFVHLALFISESIYVTGQQPHYYTHTHTHTHQCPVRLLYEPP